MGQRGVVGGLGGGSVCGLLSQLNLSEGLMVLVWCLGSVDVVVIAPITTPDHAPRSPEGSPN